MRCSKRPAFAQTGKKIRVDALLADTINHLLKLTGGADQKIINCYRQTDKCKGQSPMAELIESLAVKGIAPGCPELATLDRTLKKRMSGILAFFDHEHPANGPTEAINGRLETLSGIALRFHNLSNYITRSLLHTGGFKQTIQIHL